MLSHGLEGEPQQQQLEEELQQQLQYRAAVQQQFRLWEQQQQQQHYQPWDGCNGSGSSYCSDPLIADSSLFLKMPKLIPASKLTSNKRFLFRAIQK